jgi:predicted HTH transcriptional regulator
MKRGRPNHVWESLKDNDFLYKLGAIRRDAGGHFRPTGAGLLMFGHEYEIVKEYPYYFLDYQEQMDVSTRWTDRIVSSSGDWSGNLHDFYFRAYNRIAQDIKVPFQIEQGQFRVEDTPVHKALREILVNCLVNADYYLTRGIVIIKRFDSLSAANPGGFRMDIREAISGGNSDPRNVTLMKMFSFLDVGERAGSGIPNIFAVWKEQGWGEPAYEERYNPDRTILTLAFNTATESNAFTAPNGTVNGTASGTVEELPMTVRILREIRLNPNITVDGLGIAVKKSRRTILRAIKKLKDEKQLDRDGSDKAGHWVVLETEE